MYYEKRNLENIEKLAPNTKRKTLEWYEYCKKHNIHILIYETIRSVEQQRLNVMNKKSKTMQSYHLVGQALDFVPVDSKGNCLWSIKDYTTPKMLQAIKYAKELGFTWGGDWDNDGNWRDETFLDSPHLQYTYKGYGTDKEEEKPVSHNQMIYLVNLLYTGTTGQKKWAKKELLNELK